MNVIVSNLNKYKFVNLDIDILKTINGEFTAEELVQTFSNFFFNKMFLDITSISNYTDINNLKKISIGLDVSKIILYLSDDPIVNSERYISSLVSMGFYNFAKNEMELKYLYNNPNSYKDVAHLQKIDINPTLDNTPEEKIKTISNIEKPRIIGFKNFTNHAGATSLIYILKKELAKNYYTIAIEVNKRDFLFFNDKDMVSCKIEELNNTILKYISTNIILIDLNDTDITTAASICDEIIYLMESSTLMINKLVMLDNDCFNKVSDSKVVLNKSLLSDTDIKRLQFEAGIKFYHVLPPMNDREDNSQYLLPLLEKLDLFTRV